ncbi:hypothetical protein PRK78_004261 [Emydomyces testavorans]|uniref:Uncharacterized protein n=1 Tax=Emydomyces testavorans TaxID=2070801 RepID=A0AAF0DIG9_9EURO|nr:hypothetical protein PRK78_004261 [Emydomyces testavorans]
MDTILASTAFDLVTAALPPLIISPYATSSRAFSRIEYKQTLIYWTGFEERVRQNLKSQTMNPVPLAHCLKTPHSFHLSNELSCCSDDESIADRLYNNVGQVMEAVFDVQNLDLRVVDFKTYQAMVSPGVKVPDMVIMHSDTSLGLIGEVQAPWKHYLSVRRLHECELRRCLGPIARDMHTRKCKYGFLSTYDETIFLKQGPHPFRAGEWALWYSDIIFGNQNSMDIDSTSPADLHGKVSLRECFLYLGNKIAARQDTAHNPTDVSQWVNRINKSTDCNAAHFSDDPNIPIPWATSVPHEPYGSAQKQPGQYEENPYSATQEQPVAYQESNTYAEAH